MISIPTELLMAQRTIDRMPKSKPDTTLPAYPGLKVEACALIPEGRAVVNMSDGGFWIINLETGQAIHVPPAEGFAVPYWREPPRSVEPLP